eukprot:ctg_2785.g522
MPPERDDVTSPSCHIAQRYRTSVRGSRCREADACMRCVYGSSVRERARYGAGKRQTCWSVERESWARSGCCAVDLATCTLRTLYSSLRALTDSCGAALVRSSVRWRRCALRLCRAQLSS